MKDLKGKVALITGGGTGIGLALAQQLASEGMNLILTSTNQERLDSGASEVRKSGAEVMTIICDVSDRDSVKNLHDESIKKFGQIDVLVCNAGVTTSGEFFKHRQQDWEWVYGVVLNGTVHCIEFFYPEMVKRGSGHIVINGSQAGMVPNWVTLHGPYTSAKAAVHALGSALRLEAQDYGVGVSTVIIAGTQTEIMKSERSRPERFGESLQVPVKKREARRVPPAEVAEKIVTGIKEDAGWVATHPDLKGKTKQYFDEILAAYDR